MSKKKKPLAPPPEPLAGLIDAHSHTWDAQLQPDHDEVLARAWETGLAAIVQVGCDLRTTLASHAIASTDARMFATAGLHPHSASHLAEERDAIEAAVAGGGYVAIGETGLDFFRNLSSPDDQYAALHWQLDLARRHDLSVVIHSRDADEACFDVLRDWASEVGRYLGPDREIGMMHCYAGDLELAERYMAIGFMISIPGPVTFPGNDRGQTVARSIPLERMLVETDCPYLTPLPWRGRRNEPAYVAETARFIAGLRGIDATEVARHTAENAARLFGFALPIVGADPGETS